MRHPSSNRFTRIRLENWRNFKEAEVDLQRRVFLVGPNASGKSNFLDSFRFLHDIVSIGGGFQEAVRRRGQVSAIRCLAARKYPEVGIRVAIGDDAEPERWQYELRFAADKRKRPIVKGESVWRGGVRLFQRPDDEDRSDPERLTQTFVEQVNRNREFRFVAEVLASVRYLHIVPQLVREPDRSVGKVNDPFGGDFLEQVARTPKKTRRARLTRITKALRVAVPQLKELRLGQDPRGFWHLEGKYEHWRPQGAWQSEESFSDGTLRLMGLLWAVLGDGGPLLLEEPELSLHPEVIHYLPQMFHRIQRLSGRQILLSTHSPELLKDPGIGLDEVLMLRPSAEGSEVCTAGSFADIRTLLDGGVPLADLVIPHTRPPAAEQLPLFADSR